MRRLVSGVGGLFLVLGLMLAGRPALAVIERAFPLKEAIAESQLIFTAKVESVAPDRPAAVLTVDEDLKGKAPFRRLAVNLTGDAEGRKKKETPQLLKRIAPKLLLVVFAVRNGKTWIAFAYTNGTWFQMTGAEADGAVRWGFTHFEPYFRRTYKGPTAELKQIVADALAGKKEPPKHDPKEKPGIGPEVEASGGRKPPDEGPDQGAYAPRSPGGMGPLFGAIPTVLVAGPLAVLAMLFPNVFGGWKRWLTLVSVACTASTLYFVQYLLSGALAGTWWGSPLALWMGITLVTIAGAAWAWRRHAVRVQAGDALAAPGKAELIVLLAASVVGLGVVGWCLWEKQSLVSPQWMLVLILCVGAWAALPYVLYARWAAGRPPRSAARRGPAVATEAVMLTAMALACAAVAGAAQPAARQVGGVEVGEGEAAGEFRVGQGRLLWTFFAPDKGAVLSSPLVVGNRVYFGAAHDSVFRPYGAVYCVEADTGKFVWGFNDDKKLKQVSISSPCFADGRIYIGEGFHQDANCKVYCLKADSGEKLWDFQTASHTESSPCVAGGKVFIGAGDDGLYCLDAATGKEVWHFSGQVHVDASPCVAGNRVYCGAGIGDAFQNTQIFCLDADTGKPLWRDATDLPVWGSPTAAGDLVYYGIGNGRMNESDPRPKGALLCVAAKDGKRVWRCDLPDGVLGRPTVDGLRVYVGCRDGYLYCLDRRDGTRIWRRDLGSPVVTSPAAAESACYGVTTSLYAVGADGLLACVDAATGRALWKADVAAEARGMTELYSSPAVAVRRDGDGERRRVYFGATHGTTGRVAAVYCYEDEVKAGAAPEEKP
ncbi:MAG TPA: PQQ-binding-like beta-propeller repeat protein [Gemmataceae bacterium]|nr:PQQ-binding-like beta-propeller repeat protein [Gemmataceae bacterium]